MEIEDDCIAVLSGICLDPSSDDKFRASVTVETSKDNSDEKERYTVACVSTGVNFYY